MKSVVERIQYIESLVCEMANITPRIHKLNIDVKINVLQPSDKQLNHDPRVKIFQGRNLYDCYYITLDNIQLVHSPKKDFLSTKQIKKIIQHIKTNKRAYLELWNDPAMDLDEFERLLK